MARKFSLSDLPDEKEESSYNDGKKFSLADIDDHQEPSLGKTYSSILSGITLPIKEAGANTVLGLQKALLDVVNGVPRAAIELSKTMSPFTPKEAFNAIPTPNLKGPLTPQMLGIPDTSGNRLSQGLISSIPSMFVPEVKGAAFLGRALPQMGAGAIADQEDPTKGAILGGIGHAILGEGVPAAFKGIKSLAEKANPKEATKLLAEKIFHAHNEYENMASDLYNSVTNKYGNRIVTNNPKEFLNYDKSILRYFTPDVKKAYQDFLDKKDFNSLHMFQSQLFKDASRYQNNSNRLKTYQSLVDARNIAKNKIDDILAPDPVSLNNYKNAANITLRQLSPVRSNETIRKIGEGRISDLNLTPNKLQEELKKTILKNDEGVMQNHYLRNALNELNPKLDAAKVMKISTLGGAKALELAQIPSVQKVFQNYLSPYYDKLRKGIMFNYLGTNNPDVD